MALSREKRRIVFESGRRNHLAVSPWVTRLRGESLLCVFATDEDQPPPSKSGTHPRHLKTDVKAVSTCDEGRIWSAPTQTVFAAAHRCYAPGALLLQDGSVLVTCQDYSIGGYRAFHGVVVP